MNAADAAAWQAVYDEAPFIKQLLTPGQIRRLPLVLQTLLVTPNFKGRFFF